MIETLERFQSEGLTIILQSYQGLLLDFNKNRSTLTNIFWEDSVKSVCEDKIANIQAEFHKYQAAKTSGSQYDDQLFVTIADYVVFRMFSNKGKYKIEHISNWKEINEKTYFNFADEEISKIVDNIFNKIRKTSSHSNYMTYYLELTRFPIHMRPKDDNTTLWEQFGDIWKDKNEWAEAIKLMCGNMY